MTTATMNNFSIINEEGYMGSHGFVGSNNKAWNFSNLSQVIRKALRDNLAVTKKSNINVKNGGGSYITTIDVTIKLERDKFAKSWREALKSFDPIDYRGLGWSRWNISQFENGQEFETTREEFFKADKAEQAKIIDRFFDWACNHFMSLNKKIEANNMPVFFLTDEAHELLEKANQIVNSFNSDHSNSMVDYFDRSFYETIYIQWV